MKSKKDLLINVIIIVLVILLTIIVLYKFVLNSNNETFVKIENLNQIIFKDFNEKTNTMKSLLSDKCDNYFLIFEINDCGSCISKGIENLKYFKDRGQNTVAIIIYDRPSELLGWAKNYSFKKFITISKKDFYNYFNCQYLPVFFNISKNRIKSIKYITM